ncbi:MAG: diguanylate cyclase [Gammaproteobacteria bacterium]|nr:diguanylate cyclase [Gammaproteobacteria bacterium]MBU1655855.1 diguanylate cyclase [Gammaproteobacteria bacterium]MBU1960090.1 diguanylate cyclase [Gammaproteobacteria bacterium]
MKTIRDHLLAILNAEEDTGSRIHRLQQAAKRYGARLFPELLGILTSLELEEQEALRHWEGIVGAWQGLEQQLGRDISLQTAVCDYFSTNSGPLKAPKIIDTGLYETTMQNAYLDKLTGLYNRRFIDEVMGRELALAKRHASELSLLFFDIDNFKEINDTYGHGVGDLYLQLVADIISNTKRMEDIACRYGGEEMLLILPSASGQDALNLGRRILKRVEKAALNYLGHRISTTISAGLATYPRYGETADELLQSCDAALYRAKGSGKNTIAYATIDKRRGLRVDVSLPVMVRRFGFDGEQDISAFGQDISLSGFSFQTDTRLPMGSFVEVLFPLPEQDALTLIGEIVRVDDSIPRSVKGASMHHPSFQGLDVGAELCFKRMDKLCQRAITSYIVEHGRQ